MSDSLLTKKQKRSLELSILGYLNSNGYAETCKAFKNESPILRNESKDTLGIPKQLESKWGALISLHTQILKQEEKIRELEELLSKTSLGRAYKSKESGADSLPANTPRHTLSGHKGAITGLSFHPFYNIIASSSEDATIKIWDWERGKFEKTVRGHQDIVKHVDFSDNGKLLVSCSNDMSIKLWDADTFKCVRTIVGHDNFVLCSIFSPGSDFVISGSADNSIKIWDSKTGQLVRSLTGHTNWVRCVAMNAEGTMVASGSNDHTGRVWDFSTGKLKCTLEGHSHVVECIAFSPEESNKYLIEDSEEGSEDLDYDEGGSDEYESELDEEYGSGVFVATGSRDNSIKIWDSSTGECMATLEGHTSWVKDIRFLPDGKHLVSVSDDKSIRVWDLVTAKCVKIIELAHKTFINTLVVNPQILQLATGGNDNAIKIWDFE